VLDYYVAAPLGKIHVLDEYLRRLTLQDYKPRKILFALEDYAVEPEVIKKYNRELDIEIIRFKTESKIREERIAIARNILRQRILEEKQLYTLWLDTDILVPKNLSIILDHVVEQLRPIMVIIPYPNVHLKIPFIGGGGLLTHIYALQLADFTPVRVDYPEKYVDGEDYSFIARVVGLSKLLFPLRVYKIVLLRNINTIHCRYPGQCISIEDLPEKTRCAGEFLLDSYNVVKLDISQLGED